MLLIICMIVWYAVAGIASMFWLYQAIVSKNKTSIWLGSFILLTLMMSIVLWIAIGITATALGG